MNLRKSIRSLGMLLMLVLASWGVQLHAATEQPTAVTSLLNRIGGEGTADRFLTVLDASLATSSGQDVFVITSANGKPCIKGSTTLALTTGVNWYLNHVAHVNLAWNHLTTDLTSIALPLPEKEEKHTCSVPYRYYLNYCTFSYSMSTWTWERWQQEIDWMALHGINMPLQIVGLDVVWYNMLTKDLGYTEAEANKFIAGPCFQAWWGMNNLQGWGGPNPSWWYKRQEQLCKQILQRQRELGMEPVLPGYSGMVPSDIASKGYKANNQGNWCNFLRPYILDPNSTAFSDISALYYKRLSELMGTSTYYSMDPFHEGANTSGIDVPSAYKKIAEAMYAANSKGKWVIQYWQWSGAQYNVLSQVAKGKLIVLDLYSDAHTHFGEYNGHDAIYCMLPNFGGRTGMFGRLTKVMEQFYAEKKQHSNVKGIGATPEAIEQVPVLYDALFELPWYASAPNAKNWLANYAESRYGVKNSKAQAAWELIRNSALNCPTALQGPQEAVLCARPALTVNAVSSWGGTEIFYDAQDIVDAAFSLIEARSELSGENYSYDLTDVSRQALTDYANKLLKAINAAYTSKNKAAYQRNRDAYLQLILDLDELLNTNKNFMLGRWTNMARGIADEVSGTTEADRQWLELDNARTLISTWGNRDASENGGLRDYSYREWGGMLKDFYYDRWKKFFTNLDAGRSQPDWFEHDWNWAHNASLSYPVQPTGNTAEVAERLLNKYFATFHKADGSTTRVNRIFANEASSRLNDTAFRGESYSLPLQGIKAEEVQSFSIDFNNDGIFSEDESTSALALTVPATSAIGQVKAHILLTDGTEVTYTLVLKDHVTKARTVSATSADDAQGKVSITGSTNQSITTTDDVTLKAIPASGYDFYNWTDAAGQAVSTDNPYTYYGAADAAFTAHFIVNKWGSPKEDLSEISVINSYGQYINQLSALQNGREEQSLYSASACPTSLFQNTKMVEAAQGSQLKLHWTSAGGLNYCRLSAYADLNSDGDFNDEGELLAVVGQKESAGNNQLNDYTLTILLPYDIPEGLTHIRLRFDGAWAGGQDSKTGAMPADASTQRMVYEIPVNILQDANYPCTVSVTTADAKKGTVDANGQPDTYTYGVGEEVVLRAYPSAGYMVKTWTDAYGREVPASWRDGHFLRFHAKENATYTAVFSKELPATLAFGNWEFEYKEENDRITLTKAIRGEGELVIPSDIDGDYTITSLSTSALQGQTALTSLTLPASLNSFGETTLLSTSVTGNGTQDAPIAMPNPLTKAQDWQLDMNVTTDGSSFNQWGSALLATGGEALGSTYDRGFQLYLKASGGLILKLGSEEVKTFDIPASASEFDIVLTHSQTSALSMTVSADAWSDSYEASDYELSDIAQFCTALPAGVNLSSLTVTDPSTTGNPFSGCTRLEELKVKSGNKTFKAISNVLYSADGSRLLAYPDGRLSHRVALTNTVKSIAPHAFSRPTDLERITITGTMTPPSATDAFDGKDIYVQTTAQQADAYRKAWGLPIVVSVSNSASLSDAQCAQLTASDAVELASNDTQCGTAPGLAMNIPLWLSRTFKAGQFYLVCFPTAPVGVSVEGLRNAETSLADIHAYRFEGSAFVPATPDAAGTYLIEVPQIWGGKRVSLRFAHATSASEPLATFGLVGNGSASNRETTAQAYAYDAATNTFQLQPMTDVKFMPFGAVLLGNESMPQSIAAPQLTTGIHTVTADTDEEESTYTPAGIRATHSYRGTVISAKGKKTFKRK